MVTTIQKWGNSFAVRIPKELVLNLALKEGSSVVVREDTDAIIIRKEEPQNRRVRKNDWKQYLIPTRRKKENVSGAIDQILYGISR